MARTVWGIDVSPTSLKAVKLSGSTASPILQDIVRIDFDVVSPDEDDDINPHVREGLQEFSATHDLSGTRIAASLPSHTTFNRFIQLPPVDESRVKEIVQYEAQQHIPFPLDEVIWSYERIERDYDPGEELEVILFAIKKEIVNRFMDNLKAADIDADIIQFSPVALYNFIAYDQPVDRTTAILDIGANNCDLLIIEDERYWIRNVPLAASDFTKALQDKLKLEFEKAETLKKKAAKSKKAKQYYQIMQPVLRDLVQEIHRSVGFYKSMSEGSQLEQIYLTGGGAKTLRLKEFVGENLQLPSGVISGFQRIQKGSNLDQATLEREAPTITPALGLGLQALETTKNNINLIPSEVKKEKQLKRKRPFVIAAGVILALAIGLWYMAASTQISSLKEELQIAKNTLDEVKNTNNKIEKARTNQDLKNLESLSKQIGTWSPNRKLPVVFWKEIQNVLPNNVAVRNKLNTELIPYYQHVDQLLKNQDDLEKEDFSYQNFRVADLDTMNLNERVRNQLSGIQDKIHEIEKEFVWLLEVNYRKPSAQNGGGERETQELLTLEVKCAIITRGNTKKDGQVIQKRIAEPIRKALNIPEGETDVIPLTESSIGSLDLALLQEDNQDSGPFSTGGGEGVGNMFQPFSVQFSLNPSNISSDGTYKPANSE